MPAIGSVPEMLSAPTAETTYWAALTDKLARRSDPEGVRALE